MPTANTIRVSRDKLRAAIALKLKEAEAAHAKALKEYTDASEPFRLAAIAALAEALKYAKETKDPEALRRYFTISDWKDDNDLTIRCDKKLKQKPNEAKALEALRRALIRIDLAAEETLLLRDSDDLLSYL